MTSIEFAEAVRCLAGTARRAGYRAPAFRSRPHGSANRTIRRRLDGSATVAVVLRDRPMPAVMCDLIDGIVATNSLEGAEAANLRDDMWASVVSMLEHGASNDLPETPPDNLVPDNVVRLAA